MKPRNMIRSQSYACDHGNYFLLLHLPGYFHPESMLQKKREKFLVPSLMSCFCQNTQLNHELSSRSRWQQQAQHSSSQKGNISSDLKEYLCGNVNITTAKPRSKGDFMTFAFPPFSLNLSSAPCGDIAFDFKRVEVFEIMRLSRKQTLQLKQRLQQKRACELISLYFFWLFKFTSRGVKCFVFFSFTKLLKIGYRCGLLLLPVVVLRRFFISRSLAFSFLFALLFAMCFLRIKSGTHAASFCFTMTENKLCNFITHTAVGRALMATHTTALEVNILIISSYRKGKTSKKSRFLFFLSTANLLLRPSFEATVLH